jgi:hypothetical protein
LSGWLQPNFRSSSLCTRVSKRSIRMFSNLGIARPRLKSKRNYSPQRSASHSLAQFISSHFVQYDDRGAKTYENFSPSACHRSVNSIKTCDNHSFDPDVMKTLEKTTGDFAQNGSASVFSIVSFSSMISSNC